MTASGTQESHCSFRFGPTRGARHEKPIAPQGCEEFTPIMRSESVPSLLGSLRKTKDSAIIDTLDHYLLSPTHGHFRGRENETPNEDFELSGAHLDCLVAAVTHSLGTQLGNYIHALKSALHALNNGDAAAVHACLQQAEREMFVDSEEARRSQPSLAKIFDEPLSVAQHAPAHSELARLLQDPRRRSKAMAAVAPFIRAFNDRLESAFRSVQEQHRHVMGIVAVGQTPSSGLEKELAGLIDATSALIENVNQTQSAWLCVVRCVGSTEPADISLELNTRMNVLLRPE